jgi:serine/threonine protein kinase/predicted negative regulator of RcsB-dependent stress response
MSSEIHPLPQTLRQMAAGQLLDDEADEVERHLSHCPECAAAFDEVSLQHDALVANLRNLAQTGPGPSPNGAQQLVDSVSVSAQTDTHLGRSPSFFAQSDDEPGTPNDSAVLDELDGFQRWHKLGEGGQGAVWLALDPALGRCVAVKELQPHLRHSADTIGGFQREAMITGELEHPNIVPVYEARHMAAEPSGSRGPTPFYVMRVFGNRHLLKAIREFFGRRRPLKSLALLSAIAAVQKDSSLENQQRLRAELDQFDFDERHACDRRLREAVRRYLDDPESLDGRSLNDAIRQLHARPWSKESERTLRDLLRRFLHICHAVAYAHSRGLIHRDLKPSNVMLGNFGETLVVDWGLAKIVGRDSRRDAAPEATVSNAPSPGETVCGSVKGTPAYMSPEQARGEITSLGPKSDVYSLGAILYALLTGQPPVVGTRSSEVLEQVKAGRFPKPAQRNPHVPKPLEAVCLKALAKEPLDRYGAAEDLADDVARWLDDEPVSAWPEPITVRTRRWIQRHQTLVGSTAAAVLVATVALSVLVALVSGQKEQLASLNHGLNTANQQLNQTNAELKLANARETKARELAQEKEELAEASAQVAREQSQLALTTLNGVMFDLQRAFINVPGGAAVRQRLLATALEKLDEVATEYAAKSAVDRNVMIALGELGDTILQLGQSSPVAPGQESRMSEDDPAGNDDPITRFAVVTAERLYLRAHEIAKQLLAINPDNAQAQQDLSLVIVRLGDVYLKLGRTDDALRQFEEGLKISRTLADADPRDAQKQRDLFVAMSMVADIWRATGKTEEAVDQYEEALRRSRTLAEADPRDAQKQRDLSVSFYKLGDVCLTLGRTDDALRQFEEGLKVSRALAEADPHGEQTQLALSLSFKKLGDVFLTLGRTDDALAQFEKYATMCRALAEADPRDAQKQLALSISFKKLGDVYLTLGRTDDALRQFEEGLKVSRALAEADPRDAQKQRDLSISFERLGDVFLTLGRMDDALRQFEEDLKIARALAEADPRNAQKQRDLSISYIRLGDVFLTLGRTDDALRLFEDVLKIRRTLADGDPSNAEKQRDLFATYQRLGDVYVALGRTEEAVTQFESFLEHCRTLAEADPRDAQKQRDLSVSHNKLGDVLLTLGRTDDALRQYEDGLKISRTLAEADPSNALKQRDLMFSHYKLGEFAVQARRYDYAILKFQEGIVVLDRMIENGQSVEASQQEKAALQQRIQFCTVAQLAIGDWETLLKVDATALPQLLVLRATEMLKRGELAQAVQAGDKLRALEPQDKDNLYNAACVYALCAEFVTQDKPTPTDAEQAERQKFLTLALDTLKASVAAGWDDPEFIAQDKDLAALRELPEFQAILTDLRKKQSVPSAVPPSAPNSND